LLLLPQCQGLLGAAQKAPTTNAEKTRGKGSSLDMGNFLNINNTKLYDSTRVKTQDSNVYLSKTSVKMELFGQKAVENYKQMTYKTTPEYFLCWCLVQTASQNVGPR
jgi:hypothetical protein